MKHAIITTAVAAAALGITGFVAYQNYFPSPVAYIPPPPPIIFEPTVPVVSSEDPKIGAQDPKHIIIMFGDFQCAGCGDVAKVLPAVLSAHKDTQLVWKDAPNTVLHPWSVGAAVAARCANQQKQFWPFHDKLFETGFPDSSAIATIATDLNLETVSFQACLTSETLRQRVLTSALLAESYGVNATPFFFIDGKLAGSLHTTSDFEPYLK